MIKFTFMSNHHALISGEYDNILGYEFRPIRAYRDNAKPFLEYLRNLKAEGKKKKWNGMNSLRECSAPLINFQMVNSAIYRLASLIQYALDKFTIRSIP